MLRANQSRRGTWHHWAHRMVGSALLSGACRMGSFSPEGSLDGTRLSCQMTSSLYYSEVNWLRRAQYSRAVPLPRTTTVSALQSYETLLSTYRRDTPSVAAAAHSRRASSIGSLWSLSRPAADVGDFAGRQPLHYWVMGTDRGVNTQWRRAARAPACV